MGLKDGGWSEGLVREAVWLSGKMGSYEQAQEVLARIGRLGMSQGSIWRRVEKWGQRFERVMGEKQTGLSEVKWKVGRWQQVSSFGIWA